MTHEVGHGLVQAFLSEDPIGESARFAKDVGWHQHSELYDVQGPGVREALARGNAPDAAQRIGEQDWYLPKWKEQPPSRYAVTDGPAEDMAETLMMFVRSKSTLGARSPARLAWAERVMAALKARPGSLRAPVKGAAASWAVTRAVTEPSGRSQPFPRPPARAAPAPRRTTGACEPRPPSSKRPSTSSCCRSRSVCVRARCASPTAD